MDAPSHGPSPVVGVDVGATLAKLAVVKEDGTFGFEQMPASAVQALASRVLDLAPERVGLTGCGADALEPLLDLTPCRVVEFEAWGRGASTLLRSASIDADAPYLLVSLGTGTSVLRVEGEAVTRAGGTSLGGGTLLGLGAALTGCRSYAELCALAEAGQRSQVDLLISDIYAEGQIELPGAFIAASFGKLARRAAHGASETHTPDASPEDLAAAIVGMIGETIARIACGLAQGADVERLVFGGSTLQGNPGLRNMLVGVSASLGWTPTVLEQGAFAGAVGALGHASP